MDIDIGLLSMPGHWLNAQWIKHGGQSLHLGDNLREMVMGTEGCSCIYFSLEIRHTFKTYIADT